MRPPQLTGDELALFRRRLGVLAVVAAVALGALVWRLWSLQAVQGDHYREVARENRIRVVPQAAPRGIIYDRNGELLAYDRPAFNIQLVREDARDLETTLARLARLTGVPPARFRERLRAAGPLPKFEPVVLMEDVGLRLDSLVESYGADLPGVSMAVEPRRLYPGGTLAAHVLGYVGAITEAQLRALPARRVSSARMVGRGGIEAALNPALVGWDGGRQVEVDSIGRELKTLGDPVRPRPGRAVTLTLDVRLQRYVERLLAGRSGVIIVGRPRSGEILAMASAPGFDPNRFVGGMQAGQWRKLQASDTHPLVDKAIQGEYPPGSTFKLVLAAAALDQGVIDTDTVLDDPGYFRVGRRTFLDWKRGGHGKVTLRQAIEQSCNVFFYQLGMMLGVDTIAEYARLFGFGAATGIELGGERAGLIPTRAWKARTYGAPWYDGETPTVAIGQGYVSATPLQLLDYVNVVANRGLWVRPTVLRQVAPADGRAGVTPRDLPRGTRLLPIAPEVFDVIREGMVMAVNGRGTARRARSARFTVAGKTGTAQVVGRDAARDEAPGADTEPHALFLGFAPAARPRVSVLVLVEHGGSGGRTAAPLARQILEFYDRTIEPLAAPATRLPRQIR